MKDFIPERDHYRLPKARNVAKPVAMARADSEGRVFIYYDEFSEWPNYKWYRNPIKWWKWRKVMKALTRKVYEATYKGKMK